MNGGRDLQPLGKRNGADDMGVDRRALFRFRVKSQDLDKARRHVDFAVVAALFRSTPRQQSRTRAGSASPVSAHFTVMPLARAGLVAQPDRLAAVVEVLDQDEAFLACASAPAHTGRASPG